MNNAERHSQFSINYHLIRFHPYYISHRLPYCHRHQHHPPSASQQSCRHCYKIPHTWQERKKCESIAIFMYFCFPIFSLFLWYFQPFLYPLYLTQIAQTITSHPPKRITHRCPNHQPYRVISCQQQSRKHHLTTKRQYRSRQKRSYPNPQISQ